MRQPPTGEPCAGEPPARFGGRGGREPFPTPVPLQAQGLSLRQAAKALEVSQSTLQAWPAYQERLDEPPAVVAFFTVLRVAGKIVLMPSTA